MLNGLERALSGLSSSPLNLWEALVPIGFSLVAAILTYGMYEIFYGSRNIGAGVHRTFIVGGPAITTLFLGIQTSIPLSLGLLGALSFVRFRTPVKDPAEIGFLLLLIASSIGAATNNYLVAMVLFVVVFIALGVQWLVQSGGASLGRGNLMISVDSEAFPGMESRLNEFLRGRLGGLRLETVSAMDDRVSLHYQYRKRRGFNWATFTSELRQIAGPAQLDVYAG